MRVPVVLILLVALVPLAAAQEPGLHNPDASTPTTLYFHIDGFQQFPINTQPPDDRYKTSEKLGLATNSLGCLPEVEGLGLASASYHTFYGFSTPGYVEYEFEQDGGPRYHPERGLSFDVDLDTAAPASLTWYLETDWPEEEEEGTEGGTSAAPTPVPRVVVQATLREGDRISVGDEALNEGQVVAQGRTPPADLTPATANETEGVTYRPVGGKHVYEFVAPLEYETPSGRIPAHESYNVRVDVFVEDPLGVCEGPGHPDNEYLMPNAVRIHSSEDRRPRLELSVMNPLRIEAMQPQFVGDRLMVETSLNSPWGNYDVDERDGGMDLAIEGPGAAEAVKRVAFVQKHHDHGQHDVPVAATWAWDHRADEAPDGVYTVTLRVRNDQGTAEAVGVRQVQIGDVRGGLPACDGGVAKAEQTDCVFMQKDEGEESPGPGVLLLGLLAALAFVVRRMRR